MSSNLTLITVPLLLVLSVATFMDWREHTIPNVLTFGAALFGMVMQGTVNSWPGLAMAAGGWIVCLTCFLPFYIKGGMAAGDVKLMAAVGAFVGPLLGIAACLYALIAGGLIGIASVICSWGIHSFASANAGQQFALRVALRTRIPYAGAIAAGTSFMLLVPAAVPTAFLRFGS